MQDAAAKCAAIGLRKPDMSFASKEAGRNLERLEEDCSLTAWRLDAQRRDRRPGRTQLNLT